MNKKKLLTLAMVFSMVAILAIGGTLAYFTSYDEASNIFTTGNVSIDLTEADVVEDENGDLVPAVKSEDEDGNEIFVPANSPEEATRHDVEDGLGGEGDDLRDEYYYDKLYPAQRIFKDPTIENLGSEDAYIAAKVTVRSSGDLEYTIPGWKEGLIDIAFPVALSYEDDQNRNYMKLVSGGLADESGEPIDDFHGFNAYEGDTYVVVQNQENNENGLEYVLYFFIKKPIAPGEKVVLFDSINMNYEWDNEKMAAFKDLCIDIFAYAVQAHGFEDDDCFTAMIAGHREAFNIFLSQD